MRALNPIQTRLPLTEQTRVEAWLASLGLTATEVTECPVLDCVVCSAEESPTPKAA
ncbi:MAG TPA: hypothetical protein VK960_09000 [Acidimicrobiia bacterium]|nr:hypothetical protein [Acidimicrobiia bacterium]